MTESIGPPAPFIESPNHLDPETQEQESGSIFRPQRVKGCRENECAPPQIKPSDLINGSVG